MELKYKYIQCKEGYYVSKENRKVKSIILHSTDGRKGGDISTLTGQTNRKVSVHWYITRTGEIYHFLNNSDVGYHVGPASHPDFSNSNSVGIEQEHFDGEEDWPDVQVKACALLCVLLRQTYGEIPIKSHAEVAIPKGRKQDPKDFPWSKFSEYVKLYKSEKVTAVKE